MANPHQKAMRPMDITSNWDSCR